MQTEAIIVSYGERAEFLHEVLDAAVTCGVAGLLVVDNGMGDEARRWLAGYEPGRGASLRVLRMERPGGPGRALNEAFRLLCAEGGQPWIWILDDDNRPEPDALRAMVAARDSSRARTLWASLRVDRSEHRSIAAGANVQQVYPPRSSLMGFHWWKLARRLLGASLESSTGCAERHAPVEVPFGPFGGLHFHRDLLFSGLAVDEAFHLYGDDLELTSRFSGEGGRVVLVPDSRLADLEPSWHVRAEGRNQFERLLLTEQAARAYYNVRNNAFFDRHRRAPVLWSLFVNRVLFSLLLLVYGLRLRRMARARLLLRALDRGLRGQLGDEDEVLVVGDGAQ